MIPCLDIHTHHPAPQPLGVISCSVDTFNPLDGQLYSVGIHPWDSFKPVSAKVWMDLENIASLPCVVAIGECGIDKLKGGPLFMQLLILKKHIEISEKLNKPLILHDVKAHDVIVGLKRELPVMQNWVVHGFRGKPSVAKMMTDSGIFLSFGEKFNSATPPSIPSELMLAETDESPLPIEDIIAGLSEVFGKDVTDIIRNNTSRFLYGTQL